MDKKDKKNIWKTTERNPNDRRSRETRRVRWVIPHVQLGGQHTGRTDAGEHTGKIDAGGARRRNDNEHDVIGKGGSTEERGGGPEG